MLSSFFLYQLLIILLLSFFLCMPLFHNCNSCLSILLQNCTYSSSPLRRTAALFLFLLPFFVKSWSLPNGLPRQQQYRLLPVRMHVFPPSPLAVEGLARVANVSGRRPASHFELCFTLYLKCACIFRRRV